MVFLLKAVLGMQPFPPKGPGLSRPEHRAGEGRWPCLHAAGLCYAQLCGSGWQQSAAMGQAFSQLPVVYGSVDTSLLHTDIALSKRK